MKKLKKIPDAMKAFEKVLKDKKFVEENQKALVDAIGKTEEL